MRNDRYINENWDDLSGNRDWHELMFRINALRNAKHIEANNLMHKLLCCSPEERCGSLACPICISIDRKEFTKSVVKIFSESSRKSFITYIPYPILSSDKKLSDIDFKYIKNKLRCYLKNANITSCVAGCVEVDYDFETKMWIPHIHAIIDHVSLLNFNNMRKAINRKHIPSRLDAKARPLMRKRIYDLNGLCGYIYKFMWQNKPENKNRNIKKNKTRIPHDSFVEYLVYIDRFSMRDLEFRYRLRRNKNGLTKIP